MVKNKFKKGKIYKIISTETNKIYIGSTTRSLNYRLNSHKKSYKRYLDCKRSNITSFEILKLTNYEIVLIEKYPCETRNELNLRERFHIEYFGDICVNKYIPCRSDKEYREDNKEKIKAHKTKEFICECGSIIQHNEKARHFRSKKHSNWASLVL